MILITVDSLEDYQAFFEQLAQSERGVILAPRQRDVQPEARRRFMPSIVVLEETMAHFVQEEFLPEDVEAVIDDVVNAMQLRGFDIATLGLSREDLATRIKSRL